MEISEKYERTLLIYSVHGVNMYSLHTGDELGFGNRTPPKTFHNVAGANVSILMTEHRKFEILRAFGWI